MGDTVVEGTPAVGLGVSALGQLAGGSYPPRALQSKQICGLAIALPLVVLLTELIERAVEERGILGSRYARGEG